METGNRIEKKDKFEKRKSLISFTDFPQPKRTATIYRPGDFVDVATDQTVDSILEKKKKGTIKGDMITTLRNMS